MLQIAFGWANHHIYPFKVMKIHEAGEVSFHPPDPSSTFLPPPHSQASSPFLPAKIGLLISMLSHLTIQQPFSTDYADSVLLELVTSELLALGSRRSAWADDGWAVVKGLVVVHGRDAMPSSNSYFLISTPISAMPSLSCNAAGGIYLIALESKYRIPKSWTRSQKYRKTWVRIIRYRTFWLLRGTVPLPSWRQLRPQLSGC
jgi:hypothetical protein